MQCSQPQFHRGTPPPAAEPKTRTSIGPGLPSGAQRRRSSPSRSRNPESLAGATPVARWLVVQALTLRVAASVPVLDRIACFHSQRRRYCFGRRIHLKALTCAAHRQEAGRNLQPGSVHASSDYRAGYSDAMIRARRTRSLRAGNIVGNPFDQARTVADRPGPPEPQHDPRSN
jgi:hypothetical protein